MAFVPRATSLDVVLIYSTSTYVYTYNLWLCPQALPSIVYDCLHEVYSTEEGEPGKLVTYIRTCTDDIILCLHVQLYILTHVYTS